MFNNETFIYIQQKVVPSIPGKFFATKVFCVFTLIVGAQHCSFFQSPYLTKLLFSSIKNQLFQIKASSFPFVLQGKTSHLKLHVHSSFRHKMRVKSLSVVGGDPRFSFELGDGGEGGGLLVPGQKSYVGQVSFDPGATCRETEDCYTGKFCYCTGSSVMDAGCSVNLL